MPHSSSTINSKGFDFLYSALDPGPGAGYAQM